VTITIKICGLTTAEAVEAAAAADMAGFVFFPPSPRAVTPQQAATLATPLPRTVLKVGVLVDPEDSLLAEILAAIPLDILQLHGHETPDRVAAIRQGFGTAVMKVIRVAGPADLDTADAFLPVADRLMFDAAPPKRAGALPGGNAMAFDWSMLAGRSWPKPWMLSGGLDPENVGRAIAATGAPGVDVSSGVESRPGLKNPARIKAFIAAARAAGTSRQAAGLGL